MSEGRQLEVRRGHAFRDCADSAEERYLRETLAMLQESYAKAAKPYIDRLVALHSRNLPQMVVTVEQAQALGLMPANGQAQGGEPQATVPLERGDSPHRRYKCRKQQGNFKNAGTATRAPLNGLERTSIKSGGLSLRRKGTRQQRMT